MYTVSDEYKAKIIAPARFMDYSGTITLSDGTTKTINCDSLEAGSLYYDVKAVSGSEFALGGCYAAEIGFGLLYDSSNQYSLYGAKVEISIRLEINENQFESVPLGVFNVDEIQREKNVVYVKALDRMLMFDKAYPTDKISAKLPLTLISEACSACGVELSNTSLSGFANSSVKLSADENQVGTYRELIGMVCEVIGAFAVINRYGKLEIKKFYGTAVAEYEDFFSSAPKLSDFAVSVGKIVYKNTVSGTSGRSLVMQANPFFESMSASQLSSSLGAILNQLSGVTFYGCEASTFGDPALDAGDIITVRGKPVMVMGYTYNFRGISSIESYGDQYEGDVEYDAIKRLAQTVANNLNYLKVNYLDAYSITSTYATIANLNATNISVESLRATAATIENLEAVAARVGTLEANSVTADYVKANYADINLANIEDGTIKSAMIETGAINSALIATGAVGTAQIADGSITDAKIVELSANRITTGILSVERLEIRGTDKSIVYALNNITGALQSQEVNTLNGEILTPHTITTDKIVANAITSNEIASRTITANEIKANSITVNELNVTTLSSITADLGTVTAGTIKSKNYVSGTSGMQLLLATGEWDSKNFKISSDGSITATSGAIGGFTIGASYLSNNTTSLAGAANSVYLGTNGISCGTTFKVTKAGVLTATSGTIGGWSIGASSIWGKSPATSDGQSYDVSFNVPLTFDDRHVVLSSNRNTSSSSTELKFAIYAGGMATFNTLDISGATTLWGGVDFRSSATFYSGLSCKENIKTSGSIYTGDGNTIVNSAGYVGYFVKDAGGVQRTLIAYNPSSGVIGIAAGGFTDDDGNALSTTINIGTTATKTINLKGNSVTADAIITSKISSTTGTLSLPSITSGSISAGSVDVSGGITANTLTTSYGVTCASITATTITCGSYTTTADEMSFAKQIKAKGGIMLTNNAAVKSDLADGASNQILLRLNASNHVVIGQSGQSGKCYMYGVYNNASSGTVYNVQVNSAGLLSRASSSRRTKYNINYDVDSEAYHKALMSFKTAEFCLIGSTDRKLGMIAEDVETACSIAAVYEDEPVYDAQENVVGYRKTGLINNYDDRAIIQLLVLEAQRKEKEIAELRQEINILKSIPIEEVI